MSLRSLAHAAIGLLALSVASIQATDRPNVLIVMVDDMGFSDLGCPPQ